MQRKIRREPQIITEEQIIKIILFTKKHTGQCSRGFVSLRNIVMFLVGYHLGLRPAEIRKMKISHLNFEEKTLFIPAENNKQRNEESDFPLPDFICEILFNYIKKIPFKTEWMFPSFRNPELCIDARNHQRAFTEISRRLNLLYVCYLDRQGNPRYNLNLYSFRHRFGDFAYEKFGYDIKKTAKMLRHYDASCKTTLRYVHTAHKVERRELMNELYS